MNTRIRAALRGRHRNAYNGWNALAVSGVYHGSITACKSFHDQGNDPFVQTAIQRVVLKHIGSGNVLGLIYHAVSEIAACWTRIWNLKPDRSPHDWSYYPIVHVPSFEDEGFFFFMLQVHQYVFKPEDTCHYRLFHRSLSIVITHEHLVAPLFFKNTGW